ncbi:MAG: hypothetical protein SGPRY_012051 [Prymnesium sp.]
MARLGVVANIQPSFVPTDARFVRDRLPPNLHPTSYCWRSLLQADVVCAAGSDAPVELPHPLLGMFDAMTRTERAAHSGPAEREAHPPLQRVFLPHEKVPFSAALWMYTVGGAYACGEEHRLGRLAAGFQADFVVLSEDVSADGTGAALLRARVDQTWVAGVRRFVRGGEVGEAMGAGLDTAASSAGELDTAAKLSGVTDPFSSGGNGPTRAAVAIGSSGCPCCVGPHFDFGSKLKMRNTRGRARGLLAADLAAWGLDE